MNQPITHGRLLGVVLCGGRSSRMGRDKSLLTDSDGRRFIDLAIEQLQSVCDDVCVAGAAQAPPDIACDFLADTVAFQGPITGIVGGLEQAANNRLDACLVIPVDMPALKPEQLTELGTTWNASQQLTCGISESGKLQPLVAVYPTETLDALRVLSQSADRSLFRWIQTQRHQTVLLPGDSDRNINQPSDLS